MVSSLTIGRRLQALREERDWTQQEVADRLGIKQPRVWKLEHTLDDVYRVGTLRRFAVLYGVTVAELVEVSWASRNEPERADDASE